MLDLAALTQLRDDLLAPKHAWQYSNPSVQGLRVEALEGGLAAVINVLLNPAIVYLEKPPVVVEDVPLRDPTSGVVLEDDGGPSIARDTLESA